ncbi:unnamed protein product (mitochondrion) [Plasmodiophora brassicae]|uniref:Uncharacterized protein n=1 Tax=Plasmodiophora brassicae TaxID=37360 RepID=A0A3P3Y2Y7_PLABS|nr:unnamed protein product [Plasmodiophora brassicae]
MDPPNAPVDNPDVPDEASSSSSEPTPLAEVIARHRSDLQAQVQGLQQAIATHGASSREARAAQAEMSRLSEILITLQQAVIALQPSSTSRPAPQQPVVQATPTSYRVSLPSNLPKFKRHVDPSSSPLGAREFLTSFEDRLRAHGYPTDRFVDALLTACAPPMRRTGAVPSSATSRGTRPVARSWSTTPVATSSPTTASAWSTGSREREGDLRKT